MSFQTQVQEVLNCMCVALGEAGWEGECCLEYGEPPADACCEEGEGGAWGRLVDVFRRDGAPTTGLTYDSEWRMRVQLGLDVCVCFDMCDCEQKAENAALVMLYAEAALKGVACCGGDCPGDVVVERLTVSPGEGGCGGFTMLVVVPYTLCCP